MMIPIFLLSNYKIQLCAKEQSFKNFLNIAKVASYGAYNAIIKK